MTGWVLGGRELKQASSEGTGEGRGRGKTSAPVEWGEKREGFIGKKTFGRSVGGHEKGERTGSTLRGGTYLNQKGIDSKTMLPGVSEREREKW